jgi:rSAM/selenodomain-associated transferase 1
MRRLLLFGKRPRLGRVKTRLVPPLRPRQALGLYRAFLIDQLEFIRGFRDVSAAWYTDGPLDDPTDRTLPLEGLEVLRQAEGDLGARMMRALVEAERVGSRATVIVGADSPTLPAAHVERAFTELARGATAVISPATDGGYVLIGMTQPWAALLRDVPWGSSGVTRATRRQARAAGITLCEIDPWYDVDDRAALDRLREEIGDSLATERAPATARALLDLPLEPMV